MDGRNAAFQCPSVDLKGCSRPKIAEMRDSVIQRSSGKCAPTTSTVALQVWIGRGMA